MEEEESVCRVEQVRETRRTIQSQPAGRRKRKKIPRRLWAVDEESGELVTAALELCLVCLHGRGFCVTCVIWDYLMLYKGGHVGNVCNPEPHYYNLITFCGYFIGRGALMVLNDAFNGSHVVVHTWITHLEKTMVVFFESPSHDDRKWKRERRRRRNKHRNFQITEYQQKHFQGFNVKAKLQRNPVNPGFHTLTGR